ncbi:cobalamin B12-binding domain-containing protein [Planococcus salinus]|uniref:Cobalamin-binding domain protein n=1 Tax=Planococcus salinus TaxID=1848460 RepID=A0A3M8P583_9BACL|nr:B12-binding domain-containing protein [Planococcus salinus]RNF38374.1 cobalamin-binding domain protein [Planococcus salinus]
MEIQPKELADLFLAGEEEKALQLVQQYLQQHSQQDLYHQLLTPAMYRIGELWENNIISVADEHLATAVCDFVVSAAELKRESIKGIKRKAMILGPEGEGHYIGMKMVSSLFKENGWQVHYMGPNLPLESAIESAKRWKPEVVALSAALVYRLPALQQYAAAFRELDFKPVILLGGRAVSIADPSFIREEGTVVVKDLQQLKDWIQTGKEADDDFHFSIG